MGRASDPGMQGLGWTLRLAGEVPLAKETGNQLIKGRCVNSPTTLQKAIVYFREGSFEESLQEFEALLLENPNHVGAMKYRETIRELLSWGISFADPTPELGDVLQLYHMQRFAEAQTLLQLHARELGDDVQVKALFLLLSEKILQTTTITLIPESGTGVYRTGSFRAVTMSNPSLPTVTMSGAPQPSATMSNPSLSRVTLSNPSLPTVSLSNPSLPAVSITNPSMAAVTMSQASLPAVSMSQTSLPAVGMGEVPATPGRKRGWIYVVLGGSLLLIMLQMAFLAYNFSRKKRGKAPAKREKTVQASTQQAPAVRGEGGFAYYQKAKAFYEEKFYAAALAELKKAYKAAPDGKFRALLARFELRLRAAPLMDTAVRLFEVGAYKQALAQFRLILKTYPSHREAPVYILRIERLQKQARRSSGQGAADGGERGAKSRRYGYLRVKSMPVASVFLDGVFYGFTPTARIRLRRRSFRLVLARRGYRDVNKTLSFRKERLQDLDFRMKRVGRGDRQKEERASRVGSGGLRLPPRLTIRAFWGRPGSSRRKQTGNLKRVLRTIERRVTKGLSLRSWRLRGVTESLRRHLLQENLRKRNALTLYPARLGRVLWRYGKQKRARRSIRRLLLQAQKKSRRFGR